MTAPPGKLADRPEPDPEPEPALTPAADAGLVGVTADGQSHDLLSELLRSVRLSGDQIIEYAAGPSFEMSFADVGTLHIIEEGQAVLRIDGDPPVVEHLSRGDFVLLPRGDRHSI